MKFVLSTVAASLLATTAFAGGYTTPVEPVAPAAVASDEAGEESSAS